MNNSLLSIALQEKFREQFNSSPKHIVRAPGRVNIIGEHTDYNAGFVLPFSVDRTLMIALQPRTDDTILLYSASYPDPVKFSLNTIAHGDGWTDYVHGMAWVLKDLGYSLKGWEGVLMSDIPIASGLSSSAAIELATAKAFWVLSDWEWDARKMAHAAQKMENDWLNLKSGIMDQMICACGKENYALLIDCRSMETQLVPFLDDAEIVVMDTGMRRGLVASPYNERVEQCQKAAKLLDVDSLREADLEKLTAEASAMPPLIFRRAKHVISENQRVMQSIEALKAGNPIDVGKLLDESHTSLRDDYEVSCRELDTIVEIARQQPGCFGARMTGAGFGGCAIALVDKNEISPFIHRVTAAYDERTGLSSNLFVCKSAEGAGVIDSV